MKLFKNLKLLNANSKNDYTLLTRTTAVLNEDALSYHNVRGLYFLTVVFAATIVSLLTHGGTDRHVSCLTIQYFTNPRKKCFDPPKLMLVMIG